MIDWIGRAWPYFAVAMTLALTIAASGHALLRKRDLRAALGWIGVIWVAPIIGATLYMLLGINRIQRRAHQLRRDFLLTQDRPDRPSEDTKGMIRRCLGPAYPHLSALGKLIDNVVGDLLVAGNEITPLVNGAQAYPAMLAAIASAERSISLASYIFEVRGPGAAFLDALSSAQKRGVQVCILIDGVGARYGWPPPSKVLRRAGLRVEVFNRPMVPWRFRYFNLRNHRKILVVDGKVAFTGGMNIRPEHAVTDSTESLGRKPISGLHFRVEGPVVAQIQEVFTEDWAFATGERLQGEDWFPKLTGNGTTLARAIADGPDGDIGTLRWALLGAVSQACRSVRILTPYFLPDTSLVTTLNLAAMRGVRVEIVIPERGNLALVQWASTAGLWQVLEKGCHVYLSAPPFDHSKLCVVDDAWALIGSGNWDPRSLRLNFELNVECYDGAMGASLTRFMDHKLSAAREITLAEVDGRSIPLRLRDGAARLLSPYL